MGIERGEKMTLMQLREDVFQEKGVKMKVKVIMRRFTVKERGAI